MPSNWIAMELSPYLVDLNVFTSVQFRQCSLALNEYVLPLCFNVIKAIRIYRLLFICPGIWMSLKLALMKNS